MAGDPEGLAGDAKGPKDDTEGPKSDTEETDGQTPMRRNAKNRFWRPASHARRAANGSQ
jgi:hypothetical protein